MAAFPCNVVLLHVSSSFRFRQINRFRFLTLSLSYWNFQKQHQYSLPFFLTNCTHQRKTLKVYLLQDCVRKLINNSKLHSKFRQHTGRLKQVLFRIYRDLGIEVVTEIWTVTVSRFIFKLIHVSQVSWVLEPALPSLAGGFI